ncbi:MULTISPECIES: DUF2187 family protein [Priestia]|jgi:uncharacterized protein YkvS|uniref:Uncharacterized protein n=3 Tax=Priestia TaxID=2800373 RepID=A0A0H4KUA4_9BACI|nr:MULTISPECIES: DUF2187 family protein [Priestia]AKO91878.1 hypothetical protein BEH_07035 [Priestia filamentosa]KAB2492602.1 DUF2187 domain-containing protein [Priestia endophytica]KYG25649.1 hypothetical protein AZF06_17665 [Priestia endophytica]MBG9811262.1 hypothetical protein [Priestia endophytica]MCM3537220.1 YkvS family protein [Priestia endophytica]
MENTPKAQPTADVGDMIQVNKGMYKGFKGKVMTVRESSVIVEMGVDSDSGEPVRTVINHRNYKKVKA